MQFCWLLPLEETWLFGFLLCICMGNGIIMQLHLPSEILGYLTLYLKKQGQIEYSLDSINVNSKISTLFKLGERGVSNDKKNPS